MFKISLLLLLTTVLGLSQAGCGILVGNVKPEDEKSESYGVADLSKTNSDWTKLDPKSFGEISPQQDAATTSTEVSDVAFQSRSTASIISLNSACRNGNGYEDKDLRSLTSVLLLGASDVTHRDESDMSVSGTPGLQTTILGRINGEQVMLRTVVLKRKTCVYDLVYVARPQTFQTHEEDFSHFVASLRLK